MVDSQSRRGRTGESAKIWSVPVEVCPVAAFNLPENRTPGTSGVAQHATIPRQCGEPSKETRRLHLVVFAKGAECIVR